MITFFQKTEKVKSTSLYYINYYCIYYTEHIQNLDATLEKVTSCSYFGLVGHLRSGWVQNWLEPKINPTYQAKLVLISDTPCTLSYNNVFSVA